jgi:hypothetical protein
VDGLLIKINDDFIKNLYSQGLSVGYIKVKFIVRDFVTESSKKGYKFRTFNTLDSFNSFFSPVLSLKNYLCSAGDFPLIENIEILNNNLSFLNTYKWYNVSENRNFVKSIKYDTYRNDFYIKETERYESLMYNLFDTYTSNINTSIDIRLNSYMDPCYVDAGYVSPYSGENDYATYKANILNQQ